MKTIKQIRESRLIGALAGAGLGAASAALAPIHPALAAAGLAATPALTSAGMKLGDKFAAAIKKRKKKLEEEMPANNVGAGNIAGLTGDPPVGAKARVSYKKRNQQGIEDVKDGLALMRRKTPMMEEEIRGSVSLGSFAGNQTFILPSSKFNEMRMHKAKGKHWRKYIGEDEHGIAIREYANKKPKAPIILQDENTGAMCYARYGGKSK